MTTGTLERLTVPPADCGRSKAERKAFNRDLAEWLRAHGLVTTGAVWSAACYRAERDIVTLARNMRADGLRHARLEGTYPAAIVEPGDFLPDFGHVVAVVDDPETGARWLSVARATAGHALDDLSSVTTALDDIELDSADPVAIKRKPRK